MYSTVYSAEPGWYALTASAIPHDPKLWRTIQERAGRMRQLTHCVGHYPTASLSAVLRGGLWHVSGQLHPEVPFKGRSVPIPGPITRMAFLLKADGQRLEQGRHRALWSLRVSIAYFSACAPRSANRDLRHPRWQRRTTARDDPDTLASQPGLLTKHHASGWGATMSFDSAVLKLTGARREPRVGHGAARLDPGYRAIGRTPAGLLQYRLPGGDGKRAIGPS